MSDPITSYQQAIQSGQLLPDAEQASVVDRLQQLYEQLIKQANARSHCWTRWTPQARHAMPGIYLWGTVGLGKTRLLNLLYDQLPIKKKRIHFHAFMNDVHQALFRLQGKKDPMGYLTKTIAKEAQLLFLDEFIVNDIADAMVLAGLLKGLIKAGVCLITSSNTAPCHLYKNGFQRKKFLPSIALIEAHLQVIELASHRDYRRLQKAALTRYQTPITSDTSSELTHCFNTLSHDTHSSQPLRILDRDVPCIRHSNTTLWISCEQLCSPPRCSRDYLAIAERFDHLIISGVPVFQAQDTDMVSRFIKLIDILYDQDIELFMSAEAPVDQLYPTGKLTDSFQRTRSRLIEMTAKR